jgi:uncharacterized membrane protein
MNDALPLFTCSVCGQLKAEASAVHGEMIHGPTAVLIRRDHPEWVPRQALCRDCLNRYRSEYVENVLTKGRGELSTLEQQVVQSLREHEILSRDLEQQFEEGATLGARVADQVASFGGSWRFIILFGVILLVWITINGAHLLHRPFDPFPFILLNLVLSCLAALQAPVIMMSQNRQEAKDRDRARHDYQVNLKAELEIRNLQSKIDQLMSKHWERLLEIQQIQTDLLEELSQRGGGASPNQ